MKKKLLTLMFTLVLLIGLVAAVGMNASAVDVLNRNGYVATPGNLWNYAAQVYNGDAITLNNDIVYDDKYDDEPYYLPFAADGDILLDLNGHTLDITTRADSLIKLDYGSTRLHIVNSKAATTESKIIMRTTLGNASIVDLSNKNCSVYVYDGVELVMGEEGDQAEAYRQTHVIKASAFSEIALYGGKLTNNIANGNGIKLTSTYSTAFDKSTVTLHGYAEIKAKTVCIHLNDAYDYPTFKIGEATLDAGNKYEAISHYIGTAQQVVDNKTIGDFLYSTSYGAYDLTANEASGGRLENYRLLSDILIDNLHDCDICFKHIGAVYSCSHSYSSILNYAGGHYKACAYCGRFSVIESHTDVKVKEATCTDSGYSKAGYDCACGYKTAVVAPALGHDYQNVATKKATFDTDGIIANMCTRCEDVQSAVSVIKIGKVTLSATEYVYDGKNKTPKVTVTDANGNKLVKNVDYKTSVASKRSGIGKYTVKVTFIGNYEGTTKVYFTIRPGKPASVKSASQTTSSIKLSWSAVKGAAGYTVYRYSPAKKAYVKAGTTEGTSYTVKKLYDGTKYTFRVVAYGKTSGGKVYDSNSYALLKTATKTKTPTLSKVTTTKGKATLTWTDVSGETGYTVYYSTKKDSGFKKYDNFKADTTRCDLTGLTSGKTYYFKVRTYIKTNSGYVYSAWSDVKSVKVK